LKPYFGFLEAYVHLFIYTLEDIQLPLTRKATKLYRNLPI